MGQLLFTCPTTKQRAPTGVETDAQSLRASWSARIRSIAHFAADYTNSPCARRISIWYLRTALL